MNKQTPEDILLECIDQDTDLLSLHTHNPERYPFLLESVAHGTSQARFDILFAFPGDTIELEAGFNSQESDFLKTLDNCWQKEHARINCQEELPFKGGWFLYLGYELAGQVEPSLQLPVTNANLPTAFATRIPAAVIRDHEQGKTWLLAEPGCEELLEEMSHDLRSCTNRDNNLSSPLVHGKVEEDDPQAYLNAIDRIKQYIIDGDVFQVNLSRQWRCRLAEGVRPSDIYKRLRTSNPAPFAGLAIYKGNAILSSSPERLVSTTEGDVQTRPIAGTRPRSNEADSDAALSSELMAHPKERAEHIMLIDLERNDLGRVCEPGTVEVDELMVLESYAHVHHIVSNVHGKLRESVTPGEVIRAVFPGGTITGCPKVRCMEIIAELEASPRGPYTGAMGYLNRDGDMDLNILIRTMVCAGDRLTLRAGAGIVADSQPEMELEETRAKARGMLLALGADVL